MIGFLFGYGAAGDGVCHETHVTFCGDGSAEVLKLATDQKVHRVF